jgi:hypothetical protein
MDVTCSFLSSRVESGAPAFREVVKTALGLKQDSQTRSVLGDTGKVFREVLAPLAAKKGQKVTLEFPSLCYSDLGPLRVGYRESSRLTLNRKVGASRTSWPRQKQQLLLPNCYLVLKTPILHSKLSRCDCLWLPVFARFNCSCLSDARIRTLGKLMIQKTKLCKLLSPSHLLTKMMLWMKVKWMRGKW